MDHFKYPPRTGTISSQPRRQSWAGMAEPAKVVGAPLASLGGAPAQGAASQLDR